MFDNNSTKMSGRTQRRPSRTLADGCREEKEGAGRTLRGVYMGRHSISCGILLIIWRPQVGLPRRRSSVAASDFGWMIFRRQMDPKPHPPSITSPIDVSHPVWSTIYFEIAFSSFGSRMKRTQCFCWIITLLSFSFCILIAVFEQPLRRLEGLKMHAK